MLAMHIVRYGLINLFSLLDHVIKVHPRAWTNQVPTCQVNRRDAPLIHYTWDVGYKVGEMVVWGGGGGVKGGCLKAKTH